VRKADLVALGFLMFAGCNEEKNPDSSWKRTYTCSTEIMDLVNASKEQMTKEKEKIINSIEINVDQDFQKVPPRIILESILEDDLVINCGDPIKEEVIATWSGVITLNDGHHRRLVENYFNHRTILTDEMELGNNVVENLDAKDFEDVYYAIYMTYFALADIADTLVHEATHANFEYYGFQHRHPDTTKFDSFYEYGKAAKEAIWKKFGEEVGKIPEKK